MNSCMYASNVRMCLYVVGSCVRESIQIQDVKARGVALMLREYHLTALLNLTLCNRYCVIACLCT